MSARWRAQRRARGLDVRLAGAHASVGQAGIASDLHELAVDDVARGRREHGGRSRKPNLDRERHRLGCRRAVSHNRPDERRGRDGQPGINRARRERARGRRDADLVISANQRRRR